MNINTPTKERSSRISCWHWVVFPFKAYVFAVPIAILIARYSNRTPLGKSLLEDRIIRDECGKVMDGLQLGYVLCIVILLSSALFAAKAGIRVEAYHSVTFAVLAVLSLLTMHLTSLFWPII